MEKHSAKGPAAKNGLPHVPKAADRRSVRQKVKAGAFAKLMEIIRALEEAQISFTVTRYRYDAISIRAVVPGERWEIDVLEDGDVDFERFVSSGHIAGEDEMKQSIAQFTEPASEAAK
jgi:hypothetical protein